MTQAGGTVEFRAANAADAATLSALALRSKAHWGYSPEFLQACKAELTLSEQYCSSGRITIAVADDRIVGFYVLDGTPPAGVLDALFVDRDLIGNGFGRSLLSHALATAARLGFDTLELDADPGAESFYLHYGAQRIGTAPSGSIAGRLLPRLRFVPQDAYQNCVATNPANH